MVKVRNRLLIAVVLLGVASCAWVHSEAEARSLHFGSSSAFSSLKPGAGTNTGEPDVGGTGKSSLPPQSQNVGSSQGGIVVPTPTSYRWIIAVWAARYLGVGW